MPYLDQDCEMCHRHRVEENWICEKCGWDNKNHCFPNNPYALQKTYEASRDSVMRVFGIPSKFLDDDAKLDSLQDSTKKEKSVNGKLCKITEVAKNMLQSDEKGKKWVKTVVVVLYIAYDDQNREIKFDVDKERLIRWLQDNGYGQFIFEPMA